MNFLNEEKIINFIHNAHDSVGHKRKFDGTPYWTHLDRVAATVRKHLPNNQKAFIAALCHDYEEDVVQEFKSKDYTTELLKSIIGEDIHKVVVELTNVYTKEAYPELNRKERKRREKDRFATFSPEAVASKLADILDNSRDISNQDAGFAHVYMGELAHGIEVMRPIAGHVPELFNEVLAFFQSKGYCVGVQKL